MDLQTFNLMIQIWMVMAVLTFFLLLRITAPYGRHTKTSWGLMIDNKLGWFLMEFFVLLVLYYFIFNGSGPLTLVTGIITALFSLHYLNRSIVFPLRIKTKGKKMPLVIMCSAMVFNLINGFFLGYFLSEFADYPLDWLWSPQFIIGTLLFFIGMTINMHSDNILIRLRKTNEKGYRVTSEGLFKYVSCPNLFGEMIEWSGFAILTWSMPGLAFLVWTIANLLPRALAHHKWYHDTFPDYPDDRKAVIPFVL